MMPSIISVHNLDSHMVSWSTMDLPLRERGNRMYKLNSIGKMQCDKKKGAICLHKTYHKGLKYLELFSHIIVFFTDEKTNARLQEQVFQIVSVDEKTGMIEFRLDKLQYDWMKHQTVFDIKPYFPCEDRVKKSTVCNVNRTKMMQVELSIVSKGESYEIVPIGKIGVWEGKKYIALQEGTDTIMEMAACCSHIKIIWWFDKFDSQKYRRCVTCNPPYENAKRTGIFASRSPVRPNPIAITTAKITKINNEQKQVFVSEIEAFEGTPCLALLPYEEERDLRDDIRVPEWLAHWPKWLDEKEQNELTGMLGVKKSALEILLERRVQNNILEKEENLFTESGSDENNSKMPAAIRIKGARENNLKNFDCFIPYHKITAVVGVSGSGKSSLVNDTIYAECRRRMDFLTEGFGEIKRPDMDSMEGTIPAVLLSQREIYKNSRSTVGTYSNAYDYLRSIFAAVGIRHCPICGNPVIPMTEEQISKILDSYKDVTIYDLRKHRIDTGSLSECIHKALSQSEGAVYARIMDGEKMLFQTTQKCYVCDKLLYELTPSTFQYSNPESMCPVCTGTGEKSQVDISRLVEYPDKSILQGASSWWGKLHQFIENPNANWMKGEVIGLAEKMNVDLRQPWCKLPEEFRQKAIYGSDGEEVTFAYQNRKNGRKGEITRPVEGAYHIITRCCLEKGNQAFSDKYIKKVKCDSCEGEKLNAEGRLVTIGNRRFPEVAAMSFQKIADWCRELPRVLGEYKFESIKEQVRRLYQLTIMAEQLGIAYLQLNRTTNTLSGGESQRLKYISVMNHAMSGMLYVLDEPSRGMHPKDYAKIAHMIETLRDSGNTVVMVEHNEDMTAIADNIIEIGPEAGEKGGYLVGEGEYSAMLQHCGMQTSRYVGYRKMAECYQERNLQMSEWLRIYGANYNNLKDVTVSIPIGAMTCICGVSGSGKSSLVKGVIYQELSRRIKEDTNAGRCDRIENADKFKKVIMVDQSSIGRTPSSVPATYIGIMDKIRMIFAATAYAKERQLTASVFSFNGKEGQCDHCNGNGKIKAKYAEDIWLTCPTCRGKRYKQAILEITYQEKHIADILDYSINEAYQFFSSIEEIRKPLAILQEVGLGYLKLGQSATTLSGGEASRLKLAKELIVYNTKNTLFLFDEPTTGLHFSDIENLNRLFQRLIVEGNTVIMIEHNKQMCAYCDWVIEIGPGAAEDGGQIIKQERRNCEK